ncbi:MAG TPA: hypothetical protein VHE54_11975 [Puia sp.]|nr:hypothetical protein [Puia sp.]
MKNTLHHLMAAGLLTFLTISCHKDHGNPSPAGNGKPTMFGKWTIVTVTTIAYDSTGAVLSPRGNVYTNPPDNFFTFNSDGSWTESLLPGDLDEGLNGRYTITSDSTFTIMNATGVDEPCHIDSLTTSKFVWRHRRAALFDGTIPGFLDYVFRMIK